MSGEILLLFLILVTVSFLLLGFPVAFVLGGAAFLIGFIGHFFGVFDISIFSAIPVRIFGIMTNDLLLAVPLFIFMGVTLEKSKIAEELLENLGLLLGKLRGGLGVSVVIVGAILAASTGIVGATVVTMGLISLPIMLKKGYSKDISCGIICASGTLGQIIPPSIVLLLLADQVSSAFKSTQMELGNLSSEPISVTDIFYAAIIPGLLLVLFYILWIVIYALINPRAIPQKVTFKRDVSIAKTIKSAFPPLILMVVVLGSILGGVATATEASALGAVGAVILSYARNNLSINLLKTVSKETARVSSMIFTILIGATIFSLAFRGLGGDDLIHDFFKQLPGGLTSAVVICMIFIFLLGFVLDFIEIVFIVIPLILPPLVMLGADPVWLAVLVALNLQTSFLTPPFGFSLFYLRGVAEKSVKTQDIYKGVAPFIVIQIIVLAAIFYQPKIATYLPELQGYKTYQPQEININEGGKDSLNNFDDSYNQEEYNYDEDYNDNYQYDYQNKLQNKDPDNSVDF